jgi:hypothetical protein
MAWVTPRTWASGETVTATKMNEISSSLNALGGGWTSYTPLWGGTTTDPTLGASTVTGAYLENGGTVRAEIVATIGSGFAAGSGVYTFTLPVTAAAVANQVLDGAAMFIDISALGFYDYAPFRPTGAGLKIQLASGGGRMGATVPVVPAAGDVISIALEYRK